MLNHFPKPALHRRPEIVVIGGGFSGAAFAMHMFRDFPALAARLTIVEPRERLGAGVAYSAALPNCRINVAAARMAVFPEDPTHFDRWLRRVGAIDADPAARVDGIGAFPRRAEFGRYVEDELLAAADHASRAELRHLRDRVVAIAQVGSGFGVALQHGSELRADVLVLATGHPATEAIPPLRPLVGHPGLITDLWADGALASVGQQDRVLIVGTGLTMADVVAGLRGRGHRAPIAAVSRRGLLPRPRTPLSVVATGDFTEPVSRSAAVLLRRVRQAIAAQTSVGRPWEDTIDAVRAQGRAIWSALPADERRRLLRHVQPFWDVHRYQCAPQIDAVLRGNLATGMLRVLAGSVRRASRNDDGLLQVDIHPRGAPADVIESIWSDVVVACTGPAHGTAIASNPALQSLAQAGLIEPDACGLGIDVDNHGRAIGASGHAHPSLLVVGPPARGTWGELMGLPQVSTQPREVAASLARSLADTSVFANQEATA